MVQEDKAPLCEAAYTNRGGGSGGKIAGSDQQVVMAGTSELSSVGQVENAIVEFAHCSVKVLRGTMGAYGNLGDDEQNGPEHGLCGVVGTASPCTNFSGSPV
jgi:hypothetical protein